MDAGLILALADEAGACRTCGKVHEFREVHHPGVPHKDRQEHHTGGCSTWADPDDGHAYYPTCREAADWLLARATRPTQPPARVEAYELGGEDS